MDFTPEQLGLIDAAVAGAMGFNVVATEWLCLNWNGRLEAYKVPDYIGPPYFNYVRGRPSQIEMIRPVYLPADAKWPPERVRPVGEEEDIWFADVEVVPEYSTDPAINAALWDWLILHGWYVALKYLNSDLVQVHQAAVFKFKPNVVYGEDERDNRYLALCLAFLRATGVDIDTALAEGEPTESMV